jgi:hypothetical protein
LLKIPDIEVANNISKIIPESPYSFI